MTEQEMRNAFILLANHAQQMAAVYKARSDHMNQMAEHLHDMEVWSLGIGRRGLSQDMEQHMQQRLRFEFIVHQLYVGMEKLEAINMNEIAIGTTLADSFITVMDNISKHGFPMENTDAV